MVTPNRQDGRFRCGRTHYQYIVIPNYKIILKFLNDLK